MVIPGVRTSQEQANVLRRCPLLPPCLFQREHPKVPAEGEDTRPHQRGHPSCGAGTEPEHPAQLPKHPTGSSRGTEQPQIPGTTPGTGWHSRGGTALVPLCHWHHVPWLTPSCAGLKLMAGGCLRLPAVADSCLPLGKGEEPFLKISGMKNANHHHQALSRAAGPHIRTGCPGLRRTQLCQHAPGLLTT